jgi:hypothetical protein
MTTCPYSVLELRPGADEKQVRAAYMRLARLHHPDKNPDDTAGATERFSTIVAAFEELTNPPPQAVDIHEMFERMFAARAPRGVRTVVLHLSLEEVVHGACRVAMFSEGAAAVTVTVPPGAPDSAFVSVGRSFDGDDLRVRLAHRFPPGASVTSDGVLVLVERVTLRDLLVGLSRDVRPCRGVDLLVDTGGAPLDPSKAWRFAGRGIRGGDVVVRWKVTWDMAPILAAHAEIAAALTASGDAVRVS